MKTCWLCGRNGAADPLDKHHIFGGPNRKLSDRFGLTVYLCHHDCHIFGEDAVHRNAETAQRLHEYGQRKAMEEQGWTPEQFRMVFGKNYLDSVQMTPGRSPRGPEGHADDGGSHFSLPKSKQTLRFGGNEGVRDVEDAVPYDEGMRAAEGVGPYDRREERRADDIRPYVSGFRVLDMAVPF